MVRPNDVEREENLIDLVDGELVVRVDGVVDADIFYSSGDVDRSPIGGGVKGEFVFIGVANLGVDGVVDGLELVEGDEVGDDVELDELRLLLV
ncbi:hypothetical protein ACLOJK_028334 [Asimina triloba]